MQSRTVNVLDANGNVMARLGAYGNADSRGKDSPVRDPKTGAYRPRRADAPAELKSDLEQPELCFAAPTHVTVGDDVMFVRDNGNERVVRATLKYRAEEAVALP